MPVTPNPWLRHRYEKWADEYLKSLPLEHFMEGEAQAKQREITVESFSLIHQARPDFQYFNEMLVQYPRRGQEVPGRVVPDNMVVLHETKIKAGGSFNLPWQPVGPHWTLEYVSQGTERKDYEENHRIYERELKVPYYLVFYPEGEELILFRLSGRRYVTVKPDKAGLFGLPDLETEVSILDGWVRFWFRGELVPLPGDLDRDLKEARKEAVRQKLRADQEKLRADQEKLRADQEKLRADQEKLRADDMAQQMADMTRRLAELEGKTGNGKKKK